MSKRDSFGSLPKYAKDVARLVKKERLRKKSSSIQKQYEKTLVLVVSTADEMFNSKFGGEEFGDFLIEQAALLTKIGRKYKEQ
jgi:hypothetical protein